MDQNLPTPLATPPPNHNRSLALAISLILFILVAVSVYFVWQKGLLKSKGPQSPVLISNQIIPDRSLSCPLPASFCQGRDLDKESSLSAILKGDTPLYAAFTGVVQGFPEKDFTLLSLNSQELKLQAVYYFKGAVISRKSVKKGEFIATANGQLLNSMGNKSFVFFLLKQGKGNNSQSPPLPPNHR